MFAHQVIEDFGTLKELKSDGHNLYVIHHMIDEIIPKLKQSQKFHIDCTDNVEAIIKRHGIDIDEAVKMNIPYESIYIDCEYVVQYPPETLTPAHRVAILICDKEYTRKILAMYQFPLSLDRNKKIWVPSICYIEYNRLLGKLSFLVGNSTSTPDKAAEWFNAIINLAFAFVMLLNCKNIQTEVIKAPEALNKKRRKAGKQELFDYHVLNVVVPSRKQGYSEKTEPLSHNRVHLCRGHFKEYTQEHPLFGKLTGLYWWQPHVRGQNKDGIVMKDYNVNVQSHDA